MLGAHSEGVQNTVNGTGAHGGGVSCTSSGNTSFVHGTGGVSVSDYNYFGGGFANTNVNTTSLYGGILGGTINTFVSTSHSNASVIVGGNNNIMSGFAGVISNSIISGGTGNTLFSDNNGASARPTNNCVIIAGTSNATNVTTNIAKSNDIIIGGTGNSVVAGTHSGIMAGQSNTMDQIQGTSIAIVGGFTNNIPTTAGQINASGIIASSNSQLGADNNNSSALPTNNCVIIGGTGHLISNNIATTKINDVIIGGQNNTMNNSTNSIILGASGTVNTSGCFVWCDGTALLTAATTNRFFARAIGGSTFISNTLNTTGVSLAAGGNAWGSVSDRNLKENINEVNYDTIKQAVDTVSIYNYNYIGNPPQQVCIGPMAQDWNTAFPTPDIQVTTYDNQGDPTISEVPAKNPLYIEIMDSIGVCLASIKSLSNTITNMETATQALITRANALQ